MGIMRVVRLLLDAGADPNAARPDGATALFFAAGNGHVHIVELLLKMKAEPDAARRDGTTALGLAAQYGYARIAKLLLTYGADPDLLRADGTTPLLFAAYYGHAEVVALLLVRAGADRSIAYKSLRPFDWAAQNGHDKVIAVLLFWKDCINRSIIPSARLLSAARRGQIQMVESLINEDVHENAVVKALHHAAKHGLTEVIKVLLKKQIERKSLLRNYTLLRCSVLVI